jgi:hypothetical protein
MLSKRGLRELAEKVGPAGYLKLQARLLGLNENGTCRVDRDGQAILNESIEFNGKKVPRMRPQDFSIRALFEGLVGPVDEALEYGHDTMGYHEIPVKFQEAVSTGAFPSAVGQLISTMVIEGYSDTTGFIGDMLVTPLNSNLRDERIVGFTHTQGPKEVVEGAPYEDSTFADKYVGSRQTKRGRLLSLTAEAITHDQTGQVLDRARQMGETAQQERERRIIRAVINADSADAVYAPSGTKEQLYSSGNNNLRTTAVLADWTDIQETLTYHAANVTDDRETDDNMGGQPIVWVPKIILTATELAGTARRIVAATESRGPAAAEQMISDSVLRMIAPQGLMALSSPFIDVATDGDQWDDASDWFLGDFKKQFREKIIWPLQTFRAPAQNEAEFHKDIVAQFKVRSYGDVIATDERWVIKCDAA